MNNFESNLPYLTVGELKYLIQNLSDDTPVFYQRIEDMYFDELGWTTETRRWGYASDEGDAQYIRAFDVHYDKEHGNVCINAHY